ncbi:hypothetical protein MKX64_15405 [Paenibacillus sp. FSL M8-0334]|uniref:hypothetical protein n=1 Tax=Paenibacillus sp. FSL M8-0334 TaxID=2921623 RepID=UPI0030F8A5E0
MSEEVKEKQENKRKIPFLSEGILIATMTAVGYAFAYYYDKGYKEYFLLPDVFVELNPTMIIKSISLTVLIGVFLFMILDSLTVVIRHYKAMNEAFSKKFSEYIWMLYAGLFITLLNGISVPTVIALLLILIVIGIWMFVLPIFRFKDVKNYNEKLRASIEARKKDGASSTTTTEGTSMVNGLVSSIIDKIGYRNFI